jgi:hypothetical protein
MKALYRYGRTGLRRSYIEHLIDELFEKVKVISHVLLKLIKLILFALPDAELVVLLFFLGVIKNWVKVNVPV